MINKPRNGLNSAVDLNKPPETAPPLLHRLYNELCRLDSLRSAYAQIKEYSQSYGMDITTLESVEEREVANVLQQLCNDLQARTYKYARPSQKSSTTTLSEHEGMVVLTNLVMQVALKHLLERAFPPAFQSDPDSEKMIQWLAKNIEKGLTRVYAVNISECFDAGQLERLVERASRRIFDPQLIGLLKEIVAAPAPPEQSPQGLLVPVLIDLAFDGIDQILQQARTLSHEGNFLHVQCTRIGNQLIVLSDRDPRYEWIMPAVQKRLREELSNLHYDPAAIETQSLDMTCGEPLCFLGFELRCVRGKHCETKVQYRLIEEAGHRQAETTPALHGHSHPQGFAQRYLEGVKHLLCPPLLRDASRQLSAIQVGWRHLPITLCPILLLLFGWRSPMTLLCDILIPVCNWRIVAALAVQTWQFRWHVAPAALAIAALVFLIAMMNDIYENLSREIPAPHMPTGFYMGQYQRDLFSDTAPVPYGLYVPPHFRGEKGPFPLIVYLNGYGSRDKALVFREGFAGAIAGRSGQNKSFDRFEFVAFFPIDLTGKWLPESREGEDAMKALDYVVEQYHIDRSRIYLTGISMGGSGVWRFAEAYPDKWAAVAPVSAFRPPDIQKVRHIPAWIFHCSKDPLASVKNVRLLVQKLKDANADVRYTEYPVEAHAIFQMYESQEFYDWLLTKKKG